MIIWPERAAAKGPPILGRVIRQTALLAFVLTLVGLLISVPLVRRIRRLTDAVGDASSERFDNPEESSSDEIAQLAETFGETLDALHERDETLNEYIANTTHDLAIPLTVLQHRLTKLLDELDDTSSRTHVEAALEESHYIAGLISNMSAAAKLESGQVDAAASSVDLGQMVERVVERHRPIAEQKGIELNWSVPDEEVTVDADSTLAEQALSNLVQNAVQYNVEGGHVSIVLERVGDELRLRVLDDGPGMPDELLSEVLERGVRSDDARSRNEGGQGFGLAIARQVCEQHGWQLSLANRDGSGLDATISIQGSGR